MESKHPMKYSPESLQKGIDNYFEYVKQENIRRKSEGEKFKPLTMSGLIVYLGITKETFYDYAKRPEMVDSIKRARVTIESYVEEGLLNSSLNTIGAVFNLKNNFGWVDKHEISTTNDTERLTQDDVRKYLESKQNTKG